MFTIIIIIIIISQLPLGAAGPIGVVGFCLQEVFKLTVMDLIFTLGQIVIIDVLRSIFVKYCNHICCWDLQKNFVRKSRD